MKLCCNGHDEVVYSGKDCPICLRDIEIFILQHTIADLISGMEQLKLQLKKELIKGGGKDE